MSLKTVDRALEVLELLATRRSAPTMRELAEELQINLTTAYHLVNTLAERNYVRREDKVVRLGAAVAKVGAAYEQQLSIGRDGDSILRRAVDATLETTYLGVWTQHRLVIQALLESDQSLRVGGLYVGYSGHEYARASGRIVLAHLQDHELDNYLASLDEEERTAIQESGVMQRLSAIRDEGHAIEVGEYNPGGACVAAPIFDRKGEIHGSVAISAPIDRFEAKRPQLIDEAVRAARAMSQLVGAR